MTTTETKHRIFLCLAVSCLILGSALYLLFRPTTLLMFHWAYSLGLSGALATIRLDVHGIVRYMPAWFIYSFPFALWVASYLFFILSIWGHSTSWMRHIWFWSVPVIAITAELCQKGHIIQGTFDIVDLLTIIIATAFVLITAKFKILGKGAKQS